MQHALTVADLKAAIAGLPDTAEVVLKLETWNGRENLLLRSLARNARTEQPARCPVPRLILSDY